MAEDVLRRQVQTGLAGPRDHLDAQDRVAAELEEVVLHADLVAAEQL
jgi:hypothetical protein